MKILLDECIDSRLAFELPEHEVVTVPQRGWANLNDGHLLDLAQHEFDAFVTIDRNLPFQQNLSKFDIAVIVLRTPSSRLAHLKLLIPLLLIQLPLAPSRQASTVGI
jgi:predicted nuclease of predicted toxin-antitoxin system